MILFIVLVLTGVSLVHVLQEKGIKLSRWVYGFAAFLIVLIPSVLLGDLPVFVDWVLCILSGLFAIMFFETTRLLLQNSEMRGIVRSDHFPQKEKNKK